MVSRWRWARVALLAAASVAALFVRRHAWPTPREALQDFYADSGQAAEDTLMDPLIVAGERASCRWCFRPCLTGRCRGGATRSRSWVAAPTRRLCQLCAFCWPTRAKTISIGATRCWPFVRSTRGRAGAERCRWPRVATSWAQRLGASANTVVRLQVAVTSTRCGDTTIRPVYVSGLCGGSKVLARSQNTSRKQLGTDRAFTRAS